MVFLLSCLAKSGSTVQMHVNPHLLTLLSLPLPC